MKKARQQHMMDEQQRHERDLDAIDFEVTALSTNADSLRTRGEAGVPGMASSPQQKRARLVSAVVAAMAVFLVVALILANSPSATRALLAFMPPTATPLPYGSNLVHVAHDVPWGVLHVDGNQINTQTLHTAHQPLHLTTGMHAIDYTAAPFHTVHCRLSVPSATSDTCPLLGGTPGTLERTLDLGAFLGSLTSAQTGDLAEAVKRALTAASTHSATLLDGESYLATGGTTVRSAAGTQGTLVYTLNRDTTLRLALPETGLYCVTLCDTGGAEDFDAATVPGQVSWTILAHVQIGWRYATTEGQVVLDGAPAAQSPIASGAIVPLAIAWSSNWQVTLATAMSLSPICQMAQELVRARLDLSGQTVRTASLSNPAEGCLVAVGVVGANGTFAGQVSYFLYRFGVLVAVNEPAQALFPSVPAATPTERALISQFTALLA